ncbi:ATP-binding protein [Flavobacterium columnare]|uniref:ATP-binding protein n=1 Tax=Flavobacterium columnare TaxID=996 RepID=UPI002D211B7A|nr:ATP-binding protein [Flavobacterium columnare]MEB3799829.1 ATP-binding protein [Flavobacterium columnare]
MIQITPEFKDKVVTELFNLRQNFSGTDSQFAKQWNINGSVWSQIKAGKRDGLLKDTQWLTMGRELNVNIHERRWNIARTEVYRIIEEDILFCQANSKSKMFVDECEIGKTTAAKHLSRTLKNCFYVDASQAKTKQLFIRLIAKTIGLDSTGKYADVIADVKYYLKSLPHPPIVIIDEAGDLVYDAFLELKELWNATENCCGWYLIGADGLRTKVRRGISSKKVGYEEIFSRFSGKYSNVVPTDRQQKLQFYKQLIGDVLDVNVEDKKIIPAITKRCLTSDDTERIGGLRRAESLLIISSQQ